ncbi:2'-5' RNA ligase family protein [Candidatus Fermentibacterales bacterium]|nr:2'-5' RNA ligase family protein [Candidatus Fermentibacterales bacterium]
MTGPAETYSICSLLDREASKLARSLADSISEWLGATSDLAASSLEHLSYHVAEAYDLDALEQRLQRVARTVSHPLVLRTAGLGLFVGDEARVLFLAVAPTPELLALQASVFEAAGGISRRQRETFRPGRWLPHITLAHAGKPGPDGSERLLEVPGRGRGTSSSFEMRLDGLSVICNLAGCDEPLLRVPFGR